MSPPPPPSASLVDRLAAMPSMRDVPRAELEWFAGHGELQCWKKGDRFTTLGMPIDHLYVSLSGNFTFYTERGGARRKMYSWGAGDFGGLLPFSRMRASIGEGMVDETGDIVRVHRDHFPELIRECPAITAHCVHAMLDRARNFQRTDMHDEKMSSLGKLSAGLAHELNNPASAAARSAKHLGDLLAEAESAGEALSTLEPRHRAALAEVRSRALATAEWRVAESSVLAEADREEAFIEWLEQHELDDVVAIELSRTPLEIETLDMLAEAMSREQLGVALRWLAATSELRNLAREVEQAAGRIHDLVSAVKRFTYMDRATAPEHVALAQGIQDSVRLVTAKARGRSVKIDVDLPPDLPPVSGFGGELNQVWLNLLDNAVDAAASRVTVSADVNALVTIHILDDGAGIPKEIQGRVFEPFFTTKSVGQGTGLGLDIVRKIVERHGGDVTLASRPGHTEFCVSLPRADGAHAAK